MILGQRVEGALIFVICLIMLWTMGTPLPLWAMVLVFFAPDLSFTGYAMGPRVGAVAYNLMHLYASGALVALFGWLTHAALATALGLLWIAHAGFDRTLGYGLKSAQGFEITHLGRIGKNQA